MPSYVQFDVWQNTAGINYGNVIQVVQGTGQSSTVTVSGTTPTATGVTVTITPYYATSKILILGHIHVYKSAAVHFNAYVYRNNSINIIGGVGMGGSDNDGGAAHYDAPVIYLDSPATTSATTYNWWVWSRDTSGVVSVNDGGSYRSNIMALEIASS